jgi:hypothetical protein
MYKNEFFQNSETKNELFKVQERKIKFIYSLETKTIFWPKIYIELSMEILHFKKEGKDKYN